MSRNHYRMISKCTRYMDWKASGTLEFGGCLTPVEILTLNAMDGVTCTAEWNIPWNIAKKKIGVSFPNWAYFISTNVSLNKEISERKKKLDKA